MNRCVIFGIGMAWSAMSMAHSRLEAATPPAGAALDASPPAVTLRFNEPLEPGFSRLRLVGHDKTPVGTGVSAVATTDPRSISLALPKLATGSYEVQWTAVGRDGHRVEGSYAFSVK